MTVDESEKVNDFMVSLTGGNFFFPPSPNQPHLLFYFTPPISPPPPPDGAESFVSSNMFQASQHITRIL